MENKNHGKKFGKNDPYGLDKISDFLYERYSVISANECTGLVSSAPKSKKEKDNYKDIYDITLD